MQGGEGRRRGVGGDHPNPAVRQLQAQLAEAQAQRERPPARERVGGGRGGRPPDEGHEVGGAVGGAEPIPATPEGQPAQPMNLQEPMDEVMEMFTRLLGGGRRARAWRAFRPPPRDSDDEDNDHAI